MNTNRVRNRLHVAFAVLSGLGLLSVTLATQYTAVTTDQGADYQATPAIVRISGQVCNVETGAGVAGVQMVGLGVDVNTKAYNVNAYTDAQGRYVLTVPRGWTGTVTPQGGSHWSFTSGACSKPGA